MSKRTMILPGQTSVFTEVELMFCQEDFLVNRSVRPGSEKARKTIDISGRRCLILLKQFSRVGLWEKTFLELLIGQKGWYSNKCRLTWKIRGTKYHRLYSLLAASMPRTVEIGYGLLHTPRKALSQMKIKVDHGHIRYRKNDLMEIDNLNPAYLEWMMGFPIGWTELDH